MGVRLMLQVWASKMALAAVLGVALFVGGGTLGATQAATQKAPTFALTFTCASAVDYSYGQVCVHTYAGTALTITVRYCSGYNAVSTSLKGTRYANSAGNAIWGWHPMTKCRGTATATVRGIWHGMMVWRTITFNVR